MSQIIFRYYYDQKLAMRINDDNSVEYFIKKWWNSIYGWHDIPASAGIVKLTFQDIVPMSAIDYWMYDQEYDWEDKTGEPKLYLQTHAYMLEESRQFCQDQFEFYLEQSRYPLSEQHGYMLLSLAERWHNNMLDAEHALFMLGS